MHALHLVWSRRHLVPLLYASSAHTTVLYVSSARHCCGGAEGSCRVVWCAILWSGVVCYVLLVCTLSLFQIAVSGKKGV